MKIFLHVLFWLLAGLVLTIIFGRSYHSYIHAFYFVSFLLPVVLATSYFFNYYLVPQYLLKRRYPKFILYFIYTIIISMYLEMVVITIAFIFLANYDIANMGPVASDVFILATTLYLIVFLKAFVLLVRQSFHKERTIEMMADEKSKMQKGYLSVKSDRKTSKIAFDEITFIESLGDYVKINQISGEVIITKEKISKLQERLPDLFLRIHRSFIIHTGKVASYSKEAVVIGEQNLPISRTYKQNALTILGK
ncbi:LytTR family DNA-binding domain-containing protein [Fulvivirgaceae bacterium BMA10]|uniref:LytTR family DNA-binding domain-containing protein n=1 Tax=Splendidivirga corallicola TaxID=3051826 RepID=A0ABT8KMY4_9BACT|nr:LytTR family DNA-binding domain-containing protein [Fulvivirgaceae bacterium BMA10]